MKRRNVIARCGMVGAAVTVLAMPCVPALASTGPAPDLSLAVSSPGVLMPGSTSGLTLTVSNAANAGPTTGLVRIDFLMPAGLIARDATGAGWSCSVSAHAVNCTRPGTGADALGAGAAYPPVTALVSASAAAVSTAPAPTPLAPDLSLAVTAPPVTTGHTDTVTLMATDAATAGPVAGPTTVTLRVPGGYTVTSASGAGWQCTRSVSCTRDDDLAPGRSFPPVTVTLVAPATASGQIPVAVGVAAQGG